MAAKEGDELARLPWLRTWFRTRSAIVLHMSNGILQINFFQVMVILRTIGVSEYSCSLASSFRLFRTIRS